MIDRLKSLAAVILAAGFFASAPALAQTAPGDMTEEQQEEMYCVYDWLGLFDDDYAVAKAFVGGDEKAAGFKDASELFDDTVADCSDEFEWDETQEELGAKIGLYGSISDMITDKLMEKGLKDEHLDQFYDVVRIMSDDDLDGFYTGDWLDDEALQKRTRSALVAAGMSNDPAILDDLMLMVEATVVGLLTIQDWIDYVIDV